MSETATTPAAEPPPKSFVDFMDESIGTALKENPKMPAIDPVADHAEPQSRESPGQSSVIPETTPEQAAKALLPDFGKLAFGPKVEKATPEKAIVEPVAAAAHEEFPQKLPGNVTQQAQDTWGKLRTSNQALAKQNAELTAKLKDLQERIREFDGKTPMATDEFERLSSERDTLSKELKLVKLEATPEYKRAVSKPMEVVEEEIKRLGTKYNTGIGRLREALVEPDPDKQGDLLSKVTDTFNDRDKMTLFKLSDDAREILRRRSLLQSDVKQALDYIEAKRSADLERVKVERTTEWTSAQKKAWKVIGEELYLARPLEGNDDWNKSLNESQDLVARTDFGSLEPIDQAKVLVQAALLPRACIAIHQLWNMYQEAATALKRYQGVTPGAGGGSSSGGETNGQVEPANDQMSFVDAIESKIRGARG